MIRRKTVMGGLRSLLNGRIPELGRPGEGQPCSPRSPVSGPECGSGECIVADILYPVCAASAEPADVKSVNAGRPRDGRPTTNSVIAAIDRDQSADWGNAW